MRVNLILSFWFGRREKKKEKKKKNWKLKIEIIEKILKKKWPEFILIKQPPYGNKKKPPYLYFKIIIVVNFGQKTPRMTLCLECFASPIQSIPIWEAKPVKPKTTTPEKHKKRR
jgi:hypothetical protein